MPMSVSRSVSSRPVPAALTLPRRRLLTSLPLVGGSALVQGRARAAEKKLVVDAGDAAPEFRLPKAGGGTVALPDLLKENKFVVLYFYNQDFSPGCSVEAQRFQQNLDAFKSKGAAVVGVSMDPVEKHDEFCDKGGLTFPVLSDSDGEVSKKYGAELSIPLLGKFSDRQTFLINSEGIVTAHWLERDGSMANVKTSEHAEQVLQAIG